MKNNKTTYVQITGGRGPVECARVVALVANELMKRYKDVFTLVDYEAHNTEPNCFMSMVLSCQVSDDELIKMKAENEGSHQWVSTKNHYRPNHKRKNWFVGVHFFSEADTIQISDKDIRYETSRSSGAGGQNVNKVETAVRAIHIPTGTAVRCEDERSQAQNKARARERLILKLTAMNDEKKAEQDKVLWNSHNNLERGNPVKVYKAEI